MVKSASEEKEAGSAARQVASGSWSPRTESAVTWPPSQATARDGAGGSLRPPQRLKRRRVPQQAAHAEERPRLRRRQWLRGHKGGNARAEEQRQEEQIGCLRR